MGIEVIHSDGTILWFNGLRSTAGEPIDDILTAYRTWYDGQAKHKVANEHDRIAAILELKDGKIWCDARYFAEPFEAPVWRAQ